MNRFMGMMPRSEIKLTKKFQDNLGKIIVEAGPNGWTITYADYSTEYRDHVDTSESNMEAALVVLKAHNLGETEIVKSDSSCISEKKSHSFNLHEASLKGENK